MAEMFQSGHICTMAYTGIASTHINGRTISSLLSLDTKNEYQPLSNTALVKLRKQLRFDTLAMIIIDEISNVSTSTMAAIDNRLRQIADVPDVPFGGLSVVWFGDFSQLPPVQSQPLTHTLMQLTTMKKDSNTTTVPHVTTGYADPIGRPRKRCKQDIAHFSSSTIHNRNR